MVKLADTLACQAGDASHEGSNPSECTIRVKSGLGYTGRDPLFSLEKEKWPDGPRFLPGW